MNISGKGLYDKKFVNESGDTIQFLKILSEPVEDNDAVNLKYLKNNNNWTQKKVLLDKINSLVFFSPELEKIKNEISKLNDFFEWDIFLKHLNVIEDEKKTSMAKAEFYVLIENFEKIKSRLHEDNIKIISEIIEKLKKKYDNETYLVFRGYIENFVPFYKMESNAINIIIFKFGIRENKSLFHSFTNLVGSNIFFIGFKVGVGSYYFFEKNFFYYLHEDFSILFNCYITKPIYILIGLYSEYNFSFIIKFNDFSEIFTVDFKKKIKNYISSEDVFKNRPIVPIKKMIISLPKGIYLHSINIFLDEQITNDYLKKLYSKLNLLKIVR